MFLINKKDHAMDRRQKEKFAIRKARTERLQRSAVMHMQSTLKFLAAFERNQYYPPSLIG